MPKLTESAARDLVESWGHKLIFYCGYATGISTVEDPVHGYFETKLSDFKRGNRHPEVKRKNQSDGLRRAWQENRQNFLSGQAKIDYAERTQKTRETLKNKYGVEGVLQNSEFLDKVKQTNLKKFGHESAAKNDLVKEKSKQTRIRSGNIKIHEGRGLSDYAQELGKAYTTFQAQVKKYGFDLALSIGKKTGGTGIEMRVEEMLNDLAIPFIKQYRLAENIYDFYLTEQKTVIECDGLYWHSDIFVKDTMRHFNRRKQLNLFGIKLLAFREDEILQKSTIVKSIISNKVGKADNIVYARKCSIESVNGKIFFDDNHLMGNGSGKTVALSLNGEIVCCLQYKTLKPGIIEISRFASRIGHVVVGGFSKLLTHVTSTNNVDVIKSFVDLRYGDGHSLIKTGFVGDDRYSPSFKWVKGMSVFHRLKFSGNTGYDHGFAKLWDYGQRAFYRKLNTRS